MLLKDIYQFYFDFNINLFLSSLFKWLRHVDSTNQINLLIYLPSAFSNWVGAIVEIILATMSSGD